MNSLSNEAATNIGQPKYRPIDLANQYYQPNLFYGLPGNTNISPEFASLQNAYGANQLLATQFSFQYSDNQGLGEGLSAGNNGGPWPSGSATQSRTTGSLDPSHFYSLPSHGHAQTADQNLFYPYGFSTTNNVFWPHPSVLEYKSNNQNFTLPASEKPQTWSNSMVNSQYSPLKHNNQGLNANNSQSTYEVQLSSNGYHVGPVASKVLTEETHSSGEDRTSIRKLEKVSNQEMVYSSPNNSNESSHEMVPLEVQMTKNCSIHNDISNSSISEHPYNVQSFSKPNLNNNVMVDFWSNDTNKIPNLNTAKSYAKAAKLSSRSVTQLSNATSSSYYMDNGYSGNVSRSNYKSITNGFATGSVRPSNVNNYWCTNMSSTGPTWNTTKPKWIQDVNRGQLSQVNSDVSSKPTWVSKATQPNTDEHLRNAEYRIKEIQSQINPKRLDINFEKTRYFVIKSYSEDDVHRSIKYKIWCSTKDGNRRLNDAFQAVQKNGGNVLLFFSVNGSGHFCGVAEMISLVDESVVTGVWCQDKWRGKFSVKWLFVKDVPNTQLRHITTKVKIQKGNGEMTNEVKPITNLRDATELKSDRSPGSTYKDDIGYQAIKIIMECKSTMSIFDDFLHYEKRELGIESAN